MCNEVCHTVRENALTVKCSLIFKPKRQCIVHLFFHLRLKIRQIFLLRSKFYTYDRVVLHVKLQQSVSFTYLLPYDQNKTKSG
jgi:hypothetical protein